MTQFAKIDSVKGFVTQAGTSNFILSLQDLALQSTFFVVADSAAVGTQVAIISTIPAISNAVYSLLDGVGQVAINATTGVVTLAANLPAGDYSFTAQVAAPGHALIQQTFSFSVLFDQVPSISFVPSDVASNALPGTAVGTAVAVNTDGVTAPLSWELTANAGGRYAINPISGAVTTAASLIAGADQITIRLHSGTKSVDLVANITVTTPVISALNIPFRMTNFDTVSRGGGVPCSAPHAIAPGDVPFGNYITLTAADGVTQIPVQQDQEAPDDDGNTIFAALSFVAPENYDAYVNASTPAPNQTRGYHIGCTPGTPNRTPCHSLADLAAAHDIKAIFSELDLQTVLLTTADISSGTVLPVGSTTGLDIPVGTPVLGPSIAPGTTVSAVGSTSITLSTAVQGFVPNGSRIIIDNHYIASVNEIIAGGTEWPWGTNYPVRGYRTVKSGPIVMEWIFWTMLRHAVDGKFHREIRVDIAVRWWAIGGIEIMAHVMHPNVVTANQNPLATHGVATSKLNQPTGYVYIFEVYDGATLVQAFGGPNDWRSYHQSAQFPASSVDVATNSITLQDQLATIDTSGMLNPFVVLWMDFTGGVSFSGLPVYFAATPGSTLPSGLATKQAWFLNPLDNKTTRVSMIDGRGYVAGGASASSLSNAYAWTAGSKSVGARATRNNIRYECVTAGNSVEGPSGTGEHITEATGTAVWRSCSPQFVDQGSGTMQMYPAVFTGPNCGVMTGDAIGQPMWIQGTSQFSTRPNMMVAHDFDYLAHKSKCLPPYDTNQLSYPVSPNYNAYGPLYSPSMNGMATKAWWSDAPGDNAGDLRIGFTDERQVQALYQPTDALSWQFALMRGLYHGAFQILVRDERSGTLPICRPASGTTVTYPNMAPVNRDLFFNFSLPWGNWQGMKNNNRRANGYGSAYNTLAVPTHGPSSWFVPYLKTGWYLWMELGAMNAMASCHSFQDQYIKHPTTGKFYYNPFVANGFITGGWHGQLRNWGWGARDFLQAKWLMAGSDPHKQYFVDSVNDNGQFLSDYVDWIRANYPGAAKMGGFPQTRNWEQSWQWGIMWGSYGMEAWRNTHPGWLKFLNYTSPRVLDVIDSDQGGRVSEFFIGNQFNCIRLEITGTPTPGEVISYTIRSVGSGFPSSGVTVTYTAQAGQTNLDVVDGLISALNTAGNPYGVYFGHFGSHPSYRHILIGATTALGTSDSGPVLNTLATYQSQPLFTTTGTLTLKNAGQGCLPFSYDDNNFATGPCPQSANEIMDMVLPPQIMPLSTGIAAIYSAHNCGVNGDPAGTQRYIGTGSWRIDANAYQTIMLSGLVVASYAALYAQPGDPIKKAPIIWRRVFTRMNSPPQGGMLIASPSYAPNHERLHTDFHGSFSFATWAPPGS